jgi:hypothetical protein
MSAYVSSYGGLPRHGSVSGYPCVSQPVGLLLPRSGAGMSSRVTAVPAAPLARIVFANVSDGSEARLCDPGAEVVSVHRLVELFRVDVEGDAHVRVPRDLREPDRIEPEDQVRDGPERASPPRGPDAARPALTGVGSGARVATLA